MQFRLEGHLQKWTCVRCVHLRMKRYMVYLRCCHCEARQEIRVSCHLLQSLSKAAVPHTDALQYADAILTLPLQRVNLGSHKL